ncbi:MAG: response regulator, partial [Fibrobacter sp.]|nr:response regulator [Fibrobacter sp.]
HEVVILLQHSIDKNISIETDLQAENSCISGDPSQVQNALLNLALNARDAMPEGGSIVFESVEVTIEKDHSICNMFEVTPGFFINIRVRDTGCGMDTEALKHLFEPFFTTKLPGKGTGLGLAAVYGTVKSHHGGIAVNSMPGKGTQFDLYFPLDSTVMRRLNPKPKRFVPPPRNASILIVDDEDLVREMAVESLTNGGYSISAYRNGDEALAAYKEKFPSIDLVIIDLILPGLSGLELLSELKKINKSIKVLIASGCISQADPTSYPEGVDAVLQKPFRVTDLIQKVAEVLHAG